MIAMLMLAMLMLHIIIIISCYVFFLSYFFLKFVESWSFSDYLLMFVFYIISLRSNRFFGWILNFYQKSIDFLSKRVWLDQSQVCFCQYFTNFHLIPLCFCLFRFFSCQTYQDLNRFTMNFLGKWLFLVNFYSCI